MPDRLMGTFQIRKLFQNAGTHLLPYQHSGPVGDVLSQFVNFIVGKRDAAFRPVEGFMDFERFPGFLANSMNSDKPTECSILGRDRAIFYCGYDLPELTGADGLIAVTMPGIHGIGIIQEHEEKKLAVIVEIHHLIGANRCSIIPTSALSPMIRLAERDMEAADHLLTGEDLQLPGGFIDLDEIRTGYCGTG